MTAGQLSKADPIRWLLEGPKAPDYGPKNTGAQPSKEHPGGLPFGGKVPDAGEKVGWVDQDGKWDKMRGSEAGKVLGYNPDTGRVAVQPTGMFGRSRGEPVEVPARFVVRNEIMPSGKTMGEAVAARDIVESLKDEVKAGGSAWDESEHPRDEAGRFTQKVAKALRELAKAKDLKV